MPKPARLMALTERHVAYLQPAIIEENLPTPPPGMARATHEDHLATIARLMAGEPDPGEVWIFAYGSLIWNPACDFVEMRTGVVRGWHRSFCLGWSNRHRGSDKTPGLMLALDQGGACKGALYRIPPDRLEDNLVKLFEREMGWRPSAFPPRWVSVRSGERTIRALTFCIDRHSGHYVSGLSVEQIADVLATATGTRGSMAEYLFATVRHLEELGIHDPHLWQLQELVAARIDAVYGAGR
ncbi:MAG TPA: gamma-glutamylcyclotransferase [Devosia sp.]|nr:gamma-glutamylcyclotransferase [Devosia sp.]